MPQIIFRYRERSVLGRHAAARIGSALQQLVANAVGTKKHPLTTNEVEWLPEPYSHAAIAPEVGIELRMIGYPDRKKKLTRKVCEALKRQIIAAISPDFLHNPVDPLLWVQFTSPDDIHV